MRALARAFLFLASAVWLAAPSAAQTVTNSVNILFDFADPQRNIPSVSQVEVVQIPTNVVVGGKIILQYFPSFTRANTPSLTNGLFTLTNVTKGVVYRVTETFRGGEHTDFVLADTNAADGATIGAWTNIVSPTNHTADGLFAYSQAQANQKFLAKISDTGSNETFVGKLTLPAGAGVVGYVWTQTNADGSGDFEPATGGSGGAATNIYRSQVSGTGLVLATNTSTLVYTFQLNAALQGWAGFTSAAFSNGLYAVIQAYADPLGAAATVQSNLAATNTAIQGQFSASNTTYRATFALESFFESFTNSIGSAGFQPTTAFVTPIESRPWTNNSSAGITVTNLGDGVNTNLVLSDIHGRQFPGTIGSGLTYNATTKTLSAPTGGSGTVTSVDVAEQGMTSSGAVTTSGTVTLTRTADANFLGFSATNLSGIRASNNVNIGGSATVSGLVITNGATNLSLTAGAMIKADANKQVVSATAGTDYVAPATTISINGTANQITSSAGAQSLAANRTWTLSIADPFVAPGNAFVTGNFEVDGNGTNAGTFSVTGSQTNFGTFYLKTLAAAAGKSNIVFTDSNGKLGTNDITTLVNTNQLTPVSTTAVPATNQYAYFNGDNGKTNVGSTIDGRFWTNLVSWTHEGTTTNVPVAFNGTLQTFTVTNGPTLFITTSGANGSASIRIKTNVTLSLPPQIKWLTGSNNVATNAVLSLTSYGGTNDIEAALRENQ